MSVTKKESIVPRGYTPEEVAELTKKRMVENYDLIRQKEQEARYKEAEIAKVFADIRRKKEEYRIYMLLRNGNIMIRTLYFLQEIIAAYEAQEIIEEEQKNESQCSDRS